eukprot:TRINITY_DN8160_c0_g1_i2.p1 TRINITY_DN8160_c0_g1~~TRINITY_DN8160_c0_g1_i2.p1  ORF type:complete len:214 (+),score=34.79 TRINITY_DN8160_c0_g1_i2:181-822(+)
MFRCIQLLSTIACVSASIQTTTSRPNPNRVILGHPLSTDEVLQQARIARGEDPDRCLKIVDSDTGIKFKNTDQLTGVTLQTCGGGRDCARVVRCSSQHPKICFEAQACFDPAGKKRCSQLEPCQCLIGDFALATADNGIRFTKNVAPTSDATLPVVDSSVAAGLPAPLVKRERCFDGDTFNIRACQPLEEGCEAIVPCLEDESRSCKKLVPGM